MRPIRIVPVLALLLLAASASWAQTPPFTRTVIVNSTGNPTADGAALLSAVSGLSPAPSYANRWVIQLEGGVYDVGTSPVVLQEYLNLVGSGVYTTIVRGSVAPQPSFFLGGLVEGASNSEIRELTLQCNSNEGRGQSSCQALSLQSANARLTDLRILVGGDGSKIHWGIRTFGSAPTLDRVQILVSAANSLDNHGIVYGGPSAMKIHRSSVDARNASRNNWAITFLEDTLYSEMRNSEITAVGGELSAGIYYLSHFIPNVLKLTESSIVSIGADESVGIGGGAPQARIFVRSGRIVGDTVGIELPNSDVTLAHTEVSGTDVIVEAVNVKIGTTWLLGGGTVAGLSSLQCAATYDDAFNFYPTSCPP